MKAPLLTALLAAFTLLCGLPASSTATTKLDPRVARLQATPGGPAPAALAAAMSAYERARHSGVVVNSHLLTLIDYTQPSVVPRLWVIDLSTGDVLYHELVAHGRASGDNMATLFSNDDDSHMSSLGLFLTGEAYVGRNGYSLRLEGLDPGVNDHAAARAIVIHGAPYVSEDVSHRLGRLGRSWGCPAVGLDVARPLIDAIKGGTVVFAYGPHAA
jgi:L,D-transpeptidase-like protein